MSNRVSTAIKFLQAVMKDEHIDPSVGLPQELFLFATTLMPCPNIDLFIADKKEHRLLLSWRDDEFYGKGWHIPGGCLRLKETLDHRIQQTAVNEIGTRVIYDRQNFITREGIVKEPRPWLSNELQRVHNISMLFFCTLPEGFKPNTTDKIELQMMPGELQKTSGLKKAVELQKMSESQTRRSELQKKKSEPQKGDLKWFSSVPDNLLKAHFDLYGDVMEDYFRGNLDKWIT